MFVKKREYRRGADRLRPRARDGQLVRPSRTLTKEQGSTMKQWMKWICMGMLAMTVACGDDYDDDTKLSEVEDDQVTEVCNDVCADAGPWELMCDGATLSNDDDKAACLSGCATIKNVKDSCGVTVGQFRSANKKAKTCDEAGASLAVAFQLVTCF